jgi:hypothetical protein
MDSPEFGMLPRSADSSLGAHSPNVDDEPVDGSGVYPRPGERPRGTGILRKRGPDCRCPHGMTPRMSALCRFQVEQSHGKGLHGQGMVSLVVGCKFGCETHRHLSRGLWTVTAVPFYVGEGWNG